MPDANTEATALNDLVRLALERADGNLDEAAIQLEAWARDRPAVREELTRGFLGQACYQAVVAASWYERRIRWTPAAGPAPASETATTLHEGDATGDPLVGSPVAQP